MKLKDLTQFPTDYLDAYCEATLGHVNWAFSHTLIDVQLTGNNSNFHEAVIFFKQTAEEEHE